MNNPNRFAQLTTLSNPLEIEDSVDFPHTGLIKALSSANTGKYPINGFNITSITGNTFIVASGNIFKDNALQAVAGRTFNGGGGNGPVIPGTHSIGYHLLVVDSSNVLQHRNPTAANKVATYQDGDTIIAVIAFETGQNLKIQYLTNFKTSNSLSVGYDNSGYTEAMSVEGNATRTTFHNKIADADVRFVLGDNTADERFEIVTDDDADGDLTDTLTEVFSVDGTGDTKVKSLSLGSAAELTITESNDDITIKNTVSNKDIKFNVNDAGTPVDRLTLYGDNDPSFPNTEVKIEGGLLVTEDIQVNKIALGYGNSPANGVAEISAYANSEPMVFKTGSSVERLRIAADGKIGIGTASPVAKLDVRGADDNTVSMMASGAIAVENSVEVTSPSNRAYAFLSIDNGDAMVGGNLRLDDSVSGGTHDGFASGTNARGGAGIIFTNTSSSDDGQIRFLRQNDSNDDTWTVKESMRIDENGRVGIGTGSPTETLDVVGSITASTSVVSGGFFRSPRLDTVPSNNTSLTLTAATHAGRYLIYSGSGGTITLPATSTPGEHYTILNTTTGNITVAHGGNNVNGAGNNIILGTFNGITCIAIGSNDWIALGV